MWASLFGVNLRNIMKYYRQQCLFLDLFHKILPNEIICMSNNWGIEKSVVVLPDDWIFVHCFLKYFFKKKSMATSAVMVAQQWSMVDLLSGWVQFPAPTWWFMAICHFSSKESDMWHPWVLDTLVHKYTYR